MPDAPRSSREVRAIVLAAAADAYGSPAGDVEPPCSVCGTPSPAAEPDECDRGGCPLEGAGRD